MPVFLMRALTTSATRAVGNMRCFTALFNKMNISVYGNALTMYPNPTGVTKMIRESNSFFNKSKKLVKQNFLHSEMFNAIADLEELGATWADSRAEFHELYHLDGLSKDRMHSHAKFKTPIDETKIQDISRILVKHDALSPKEAERLVASYQKANELPHAEATRLLFDDVPSIKNPFF